MTSSRELSPRGRLVTWWETFNPPFKLLLITLTAPLLVLNVWAFSTIFSYFQSLLVTVLVASLLSFFLNYPVNWLEKQGLKRGQAAILVFLLSLFVLLVIGVTVLPLVLNQAQQLFVRLPEWFDSGKNQLLILDDRLVNLGLPVSLDGLIGQINDRFKIQLQNLTGRAINLTLGVAVFTAAKIFYLSLTVILIFYLLQHGREVWQSLVAWLPSRLQVPFSQTLRRSFQNYFIGQLIIATCMAAALMSIFILLKVPFGLLFGVTIGMMALVPFGGSVGIGLVTFLVALRDIKIALQVLAASVVVQQLLENGIAPRVLGSVTGLNPFWVFIAILAGARIGGLLGIVVAVPTAVVIKEALMAARTVQKSSEGSQASDWDTPSSELIHPEILSPSAESSEPSESVQQTENFAETTD